MQIESMLDDPEIVSLAVLSLLTVGTLIDGQTVLDSNAASWPASWTGEEAKAVMICIVKDEAKYKAKVISRGLTLLLLAPSLHISRRRNHHQQLPADPRPPLFLQGNLLQSSTIPQPAGDYPTPGYHLLCAPQRYL
jgi:hypothetical protein